MITGFDELLGDLADVYPIVKPLKAELPAIVFRRVSTNRPQNHDGMTGIVSTRYQFTCHAATALAADTLADQVVDRLGDYTGPLGTAIVANTEITNQVDLGYFPDAPSYQVAVDAIFHTQD